MPYPSSTLYPSESLFPGPAPTGQNVAVVREYPPDQIAIEIRPSGGAPARWAADEPMAADVASAIRISDEMPGGFKELTAILARDPRTPWPDLAPFSDVRAYGPGGEVLWEGRLDKAPESDGDHVAIEPAAVGHQAALEDNKGLIGPGIIDADQSKWGEPSTERRKQLLEASIRLMASTSVGTSSLEAEAVVANIINDFTNVEVIEGADETGEAHYFSDGPDIGALMFDHRELSSGGENANWENNAALGVDDTFTEPAVVSSTDLDAKAVVGELLEAPGDGYRYARVRDRLVNIGTPQALTRVFAWLVKVIGNHGLTLQGTWPDVGFTAAQILGYAVPLHTYLSVDADTLDDDGYVIPHAWFAGPGSMAQVVVEVTKYGLLDWFVFEGKLFQLREPGSYGRKWQAYAGPSQLQEVGEDAARSWRTIVVRYQDVDGSTRTVGPPGSGATVEDEGLEITDPEHPAVKAGITRQDVLDLKGVGVAATAIAVGERWLEEANALSRSGSCSLSGYAMDDCGVMRPVSHIRSGDQVRFPDSGDTGYRKIVAHEYDHDSRTASLTLDAPDNGLEALLERLQAALIPLGL